MIPNTFSQFEFWLCNLELELSRVKNKGKLLEQALPEMIIHYRRMERQNQQDFASIKPITAKSKHMLTACKYIIEFILMNSNLTNEMVEANLMYYEDNELKLYILKHI